MAERRTTGRYEKVSAGGEDVLAFVPHPLPPANPSLAIDGKLADRLRQAEQSLSRLELAGEMVLSVDWFIYAFVRKEAVLTSQIEGTQATLVDVLAFEAEDDAEPNADVEEICNYVDAISFARREMSSAQGLPLSMRLLNEAHRRLMRGVRGATKQPGEVRRSENWIGGSRPGNAVFVPPPPNALPDLLGALEKYIHGDDRLPALLRAGLAHVQFETIHPYLDGNGRIGRMLIALLLEHWGLLTKPLLYLSLFFKRHQAEYYRRLGAFRTDGDWEGWLDFFLDGIATIADEKPWLRPAICSPLSAWIVPRAIEGAGTSVAAVRLFEGAPTSSDHHDRIGGEVVGH